MTIEQLIGKLMEVISNYGHEPEAAHIMIDRLLVEYINDKRVTELLESQTRWYG
jgi:hypothetical protein